MFDTTKQLKIAIKDLVTKRAVTTEERRAYKKKASEKYKQTIEYHTWFSDSDYKRAHIRHETRHLLLAYAFLRGRPYKTIEKKCFEKPSSWSIKLLLDRFTNFETLENLEKLTNLKTLDNIEQWLTSHLQYSMIEPSQSEHAPLA